METQKIERLETESSFETKITLSPEDFTLLANFKSRNPNVKKVVGYNNIDSVISKKLKEQFEGKCSRSGYVLPNSVKLLSRSIGMVEKGRFTGDILFYVEAMCKVYQPPEGVLLAGIVTHKNRMGIYVNYDNHAIRVMVPRDLHLGEQEFDDVQIGDIVKVEIKKSRYQVNDASILSVGVFRGKADKVGYIGFDATAQIKPITSGDDFVELDREDTPEKIREQTVGTSSLQIPAPPEEVCKPEEGSDDIYFYADVFPENKEFDNFYIGGKEIKVDKKKYPSVEHYIQSKYFINNLIIGALSNIQDPIEVRKMVMSGVIKREVKNEEGETEIEEINILPTKHLYTNWKADRYGFMKDVQMAKFKRSSVLKEKLLGTGERTLVYADPADNYWGIGRDCKGENIVGKILMEVRKELRETVPQAVSQAVQADDEMRIPKVVCVDAKSLKKRNDFVTADTKPIDAWKAVSGHEYVGRAVQFTTSASIWKNPFAMDKKATDQEVERARVIHQYAKYILGNKDLLKQIPSLLGKTELGCWCHPEPCHADVLVELITDWKNTIESSPNVEKEKLLDEWVAKDKRNVLAEFIKEDKFGKEDVPVATAKKTTAKKTTATEKSATKPKTKTKAKTETKATEKNDENSDSGLRLGSNAE